MFRFFDDAMIIISSRKLNDATGYLLKRLNLRCIFLLIF